MTLRVRGLTGGETELIVGPHTIPISGADYDVTLTAAQEDALDVALTTITVGGVSRAVKLFVAPPSVPVLLFDGSPLEGATLEAGQRAIGWLHDNAPDDMRWDLWIGDVDQGPSVTGSTRSIAASLSAGTRIARLYFWRDSVGYDPDQFVEASFTVEGASGATTFAQIRSGVTGLTAVPNFPLAGENRYGEYHLAEWLIQNPDARYWTVDESAETVTLVARPQKPGNSVVLPSPSGGDDTSAIRAMLDANVGASFDGQGRLYQINALSLNGACDLFDMRVSPRGADTFRVFGDNVRFFDIRIDGAGRSDVEYGWVLYNTSNGCEIIDCEIKDCRTTTGRNFSAVRSRGATNWRAVGNTFENLLGDREGDNSSPFSAQANSFIVNSSDDHPAGNGLLALNTVTNLQSNGARDDAEFIKLQDCTSYTRDAFKIFANRCINAGKRFIKAQGVGGVLAIANHYDWTEDAGALGTRKKNTLLSVQFNDTSDVHLAHTRSRFEVTANYDGAFLTMANGGTGERRIEIISNDLYISGQIPDDRFKTSLIRVAGSGSSSPSHGHAFQRNRVYGPGELPYLYNIEDPGWALEDFNPEGNVIEISVGVRDVR